MIKYKDNIYVLNTKRTTYIMRVMESGHMEHVYYGRRIHTFDTDDEDNNGVTQHSQQIQASSDISAIIEKHTCPPGNTICYNSEYTAYSLEDVCLEMSSYGKGDIREPFIEVRHPDGSITSDFLYESAVTGKCRKSRYITSGKVLNKDNTVEIADNTKKHPIDAEIVDDKKQSINAQITGNDKKHYISAETDSYNNYLIMPASYDDNKEVEYITITLTDMTYGLKLELNYYIYEDEDVITRNAVLYNTGRDNVSIDRLMSMQLDFNEADYIFTTFNGSWTNEMQRNDKELSQGKYVNASYTGTSSNRANPFVMLSGHGTNEEYGGCYGFNLIYSGNHYEAAEVSPYGKLRLVTGINPQFFAWELGAGEYFATPEAVMTYSYSGYNGLSQNMHTFVNEHVIRGKYKNKVRPVLVNSWESAYFNINEKKICKLAKAAKSVGAEMIVVDDGWFGKRNDDKSSLGDWQVNTKKFPSGIKGLSDKIRNMGLEFGIWMEPEMVNVDSELYRKHPDWTMDIPGHKHSEGRNQRILDLCNSEVVDYIIKSVSTILDEAHISYIKWDMNRIVSDVYSRKLPADRQGEVLHRYVCGLYRCLSEITARYPDVLIEGCASGGNRFDLGILSYCPQIWASDNTDAACRADIQYNYSYGYPLSSISAHVSDCPNHQTLRNISLNTRYNVASCGVLGYECNLCDMNKEELSEIKEQIATYKKWREVILSGDFYRIKNADTIQWCVVSKDKLRCIGTYMNKLARPGHQYDCYKLKGLDNDKQYHIYNRQLKRDIKAYGNLINTVSPVHIKNGSLTHDIVAKLVNMKEESEYYIAYGDALMYSGIKLKEAYAAVGLNDEVRTWSDFASRTYYVVSIE